MKPHPPKPRGTGSDGLADARNGMTTGHLERSLKRSILTDYEKRAMTTGHLETALSPPKPPSGNTPSGAPTGQQSTTSSAPKKD
jgi:hypothetical protein